MKLLQDWNISTFILVFLVVSYFACCLSLGESGMLMLILFYYKYWMFAEWNWITFIHFFGFMFYFLWIVTIDIRALFLRDLYVCEGVELWMLKQVLVFLQFLHQCLMETTTKFRQFVWRHIWKLWYLGSSGKRLWHSCSPS